MINVKKHSKASRVFINLNYNPEEIVVEIKDNGIGFDKELIAEKKTNFGLDIMKERVEMINGIIEFLPLNNNGTSIRISIPIKMEVKQ